MNSKKLLYLMPIVLVLSTFLSLQMYTRISQQEVRTIAEVKGLSEGSINIPDSYENLGIPEDLIVLSDNKIWYADEQNYRIVKVSSAGKILQTIGKQGTDFGEFEEQPIGITQDSNYIFVLSSCHIYKFDMNGGFIKSWGSCGDGESDLADASGIHYDTVTDVLYVSDTSHHRVLKFSADGTYLSQFGSNGSENGEFSGPVGIITDTTGRVYVVDCDNHRVQRFTSNGAFDIKFGTNGVGDGEFTFPKDVAIASNGNIFVSSQNSQRIQIFNSSGNWVSSWGEQGTDAWQFLAPRYLGFDSSGNLLVTDAYLKSIQKYSANGTYISALRNSGNIGGKLTNPESVAYDSTGNLYVLDNGAWSVSIQKFTNAGTYITTIAEVADIGEASYHLSIKADKIYVSYLTGVKVFDTSGTMLLSFGTAGSGDGEFNEARGIDADSAGNIYVCDMFNSRVQKFSSDGTFLAKWGTSGTGEGEFGWPTVMFIDETDTIYIGDNEDDEGTEQISGNTRVQVFNTSGVYQRTIGTYGGGDGELLRVGGILIDANGKLNVSDVVSHTISVFTTAGVFEGKFGRYGSGVEEVTYPTGLRLNPITSTITIADYGNHRVQLLPAGTRIYNLTSSADVIKTNDTVSLVSTYINPLESGADSISSRLYFGPYIVSDFNVNMTSDRDWTDVNVTTLVEESTSLVTNLNPTGAPGISATHALYVVKQPGQTTVRVCPEATQIEEITLDCSNGYDLTTGDAALSTVTIGGVTYWKVTGLIGTGIMS